MAGLRAPYVASDYFNYVEAFEIVPHLGYWISGEFVYSLAKTWMEPAYLAYGAFIKVFTDEYIWMFLAVSFLSIGLASYYYYRYSPYVFLTLLLFFVHTYFYRDMTQIRSAVAAAIGLLLIGQLHHKRHVKALLTIGMAGLFHMAALSFIVVWGASFVQFTRKKVLFGLIGAIVLGFIGNISLILISKIPSAGYITTKLEFYASSDRFAESVALFDITNLKNLAVMSFVLLFWKKLKLKVPYFHTLVLFMFLATAWRIAFSDVGIFAARIATFFGIVEVILLPAFVLIFRRRILVTLVIILYALLIMYLNFTIKEIVNPYELGINLF